MRLLGVILLGFAALPVLMACQRANEPVSNSVMVPIEISPSDFAIVRCGPGDVEHPCVLIVAGGKRVLIGAPAGVAASLTMDDLGQLDAVMLFSLLGRDIEGVDEVRNSSWRAGRREPLRVTGPMGVEEFIDALNLAYQRSDALTYIEQGARGGFDAALLVAQTTTSNAANGLEIMMDTGDLKIAATIVAPGRLAYLVHYDERNLLVQACDSGDATNLHAVLGLPVDRQIGCTGDDLTWPLTKGVTLITQPIIGAETDAG